jgi:hypothetical protein
LSPIWLKDADATRLLKIDIHPIGRTDLRVETSSGEIDTRFASQPERGTHDGGGAGDQDVPYQFGRLPSADAPYPFSTRQYIRLLIQRARFRSDELNHEDRDGVHLVLFLPDGVWLASSADLLIPGRAALADD